MQRTEVAAPGRNWPERFFGLRAHGTTVRVEMLAGLTTFMTMVYIVAVNTNIMLGGTVDPKTGLGVTGMDAVALTIGTILAAVIPTLVMGLFGKLPWALAPGLGYNALFAYTVVLGHHVPYQVALALVLLDGLVFTLIVIGPWRARIIAGIPVTLKLAAGAGIGLFIAFIGLANAGLIQLTVFNPKGLPAGPARVSDQTALPALAIFNDPVVIVAAIGLIVTGLMLAWGWRAALLLGILATTALAWVAAAISPDYKAALQVSYPTGIGDFVQAPDFGRFFGKGFLQLNFDFGSLGFGAFILFFLTFLVTDLMDSFGTFSGLASKLNILDDAGNFPRSGEALLTDATSGIIGPLVGTSTVTTFIESASGVGEGGKTGLTAVTTAGLFALTLFLVPLFNLIPPVATAPVLIIVGFLMIEPILKVNFRDISDGLPAFLTLLAMPLTYSIADGMFVGILSFVLLKTFTGKVREVSILMWVFAVLLLAAKILQVYVQ